MNQQQTLLNILKTATYSQTISNIAARLYLSQPYISKILKNAEANYQVTLIARKSKPIHLTTAGMTVLKGLQTLVDDEAQLKQQLALTAQQATRPLNILVVNPFLSQLTNQALGDYYCQHPQRQLNIRQATPDQLELAENVDLIIGKYPSDSHFKALPLPTQQLFFFTSKSCPIFDPNQLIRPFRREYFNNLEHYHYIGLSGYPAFQNYVDLSFKKEGIDLEQSLTVPSAAAAVCMAARIPQAGTITTIEIAHQVFSHDDYNLMPLPQAFISMTNALHYRVTADQATVALAHYLQTFFEGNICAFMADTPATPAKPLGNITA